MDYKLFVLAALITLVLWLGWRVHRQSVRRQSISGGGLARFFNFLSGLCIAAILPTVCASVLFLHPELLEIAGIYVSPIIVLIVSFAALSLFFSVMFALFERGPRRRERREKALRDAQGWTEQDAKSSGL